MKRTYWALVVAGLLCATPAYAGKMYVPGVWNPTKNKVEYKTPKKPKTVKPTVWPKFNYCLTEKCIRKEYGLPAKRKSKAVRTYRR